MAKHVGVENFFLPCYKAPGKAPRYIHQLLSLRAFGYLPDSLIVLLQRDENGVHHGGFTIWSLSYIRSIRLGTSSLQTSLFTSVSFRTPLPPSHPPPFHTPHDIVPVGGIPALLLPSSSFSFLHYLA